MLALLLLAPSIPELLTGSTPITSLATNPPGFVLSFGIDVALYGAGALLIREFAVAYRKGWASILLLGAAYGIGEEGFGAHTFFATGGPPVFLLGTYGHAFGVNWLWALGLTTFHATYSIALPILLSRLWFPAVSKVRWFDRGSLGVLAAADLGVVGLFGTLVGHGPTPAAFAFFVVVAVVLIALAAWLPADLFRLRSERSRIGRVGLVLAGSLSFGAWAGMLVFATDPTLPAVVAAAVLVLVNLGTLVLILRRVGTVGLERSEYRFAVGMMAALFLWDILVELTIPGIRGVAAVFAYLLYRLGRSIARRPPSADGPSALGVPAEVARDGPLAR